MQAYYPKDIDVVAMASRAGIKILLRPLSLFTFPSNNFDRYQDHEIGTDI